MSKAKSEQGGKFDATAYKNKFIAENYDRVNLTLRKGRKDELKAIAKAQGESVNEYIAKAIDERIERESGAE